jgi:hypothetical protein
MLDSFCLNFTVLSNLMTGASSDTNAVNLLLCGGAIDKLCKLTKAILPWYWGAYLGCLAVLLGLSHFNGSLAANFAHGKHAVRYTKIRDRTSPTIEWTKDWRVKSLVYYDLSTDSTVSLRKKSVKPANGQTVVDKSEHAMNGHLPNGRLALEPKRRDSTTYSETTESTESDSDVEKQNHRSDVDLKTSNGSIVLSVQKNGDLTKRLALPAPPYVKSDKPLPPVPPYKPRRPPSMQSSNGSSINRLPPTPPYRSRPSSMIAPTEQPVPVNGFKEVRV